MPISANGDGTHQKMTLLHSLGGFCIIQLVTLGGTIGVIKPSERPSTVGEGPYRSPRTSGRTVRVATALILSFRLSFGADPAAASPNT